MRNVCDSKRNMHSDSSKSMFDVFKSLFSHGAIAPSWISSLIAAGVDNKKHHVQQGNPKESSVLPSVLEASSHNLKRKSSYRDIEKFATEARRIRTDSCPENNVNSVAIRVSNAETPRLVKTNHVKSKYLNLNSCTKSTQANGELGKRPLWTSDIPACSSLLRNDVSKITMNASRHCPLHLKPLPSYKNFKARLDYSGKKNGMSETAAKVLSTITRKEENNEPTTGVGANAKDNEVSSRRNFEYSSRNEYCPAGRSSCRAELRGPVQTFQPLRNNIKEAVDVSRSESEEGWTYKFTRPPSLKRTRLSHFLSLLDEDQSVSDFADADAPMKKTCLDTERKKENTFHCGCGGLSGEENIRSIVRDELCKITAKNKDLLIAELRRQQNEEEQPSISKHWVCNFCYHRNVDNNDECRFCKRIKRKRAQYSANEDATEDHEHEIDANSRKEAEHPAAIASEILVIPSKHSNSQSTAVCTDAPSLSTAESNTSLITLGDSGSNFAKSSSDKSSGDRHEPFISVSTIPSLPQSGLNSSNNSADFKLPESPKPSAVEASKLPAFEFSANSLPTANTSNSITFTSKDAGNGSDQSTLSSVATETPLPITSAISSFPGTQTSSSKSLFSITAPVSALSTNKRGSQSDNVTDTSNISVSKSVFDLPAVSSAEKTTFTFGFPQVSQPAINPFFGSQSTSTSSSLDFSNIVSTENKSKSNDAGNSVDVKKPTFDFASSQSNFPFRSAPATSTLSFTTSALPTFGQAFTTPEVKPAFGNVDVSLNNAVSFPSFGLNAASTEQKQPGFGLTFNTGAPGSHSGSWFDPGSSNPAPTFSFNGGSSMDFGHDRSNSFFKTSTSTAPSAFVPSAVSGFGFTPTAAPTQSSDQMNTSFFGSVSSSSQFGQNKTDNATPGFSFFGQNQAVPATTQSTDNFNFTATFPSKPFIFGQSSNTAAATTAPTFPIQVPSTFNFMNNTDTAPKFKFGETTSQANPSAPFIFGEHHSVNNSLPALNDLSNPFSVKPDSIAGRKFKTGRRRIKH